MNYWQYNYKDHGVQGKYPAPVLLFQKADWHILPVDIDLLGRAIVTIANDFLLGSDNSLGTDKPSIKDAIVINLQPNI